VDGSNKDFIDWKEYTYEFTATASYINGEFGMNLLATPQDVLNMYIDDFRLYSKSGDILNLILPIGIELSDLDETWLNIMDSFGPTTRILALDGKQQVLLTDTVGFIRKLPHHLIEAFKSTLEEAKYADIIFHVVDASNMQREKQMFITYQTLDDLGVKDKKFVTLFNKQDARTDNEPLHDFRADYTLNISAAKDLGLDEVKSLLEEILRENKVYIERIIPYDKAGVIQLIRKQGELVSEEYVADGIQIKAYVPMEVYGRLD
jgi:hypothetical protein